MKKLVSLLLALMMIASFAACAGDDKPDSDGAAASADASKKDVAFADIVSAVESKIADKDDLDDLDADYILYMMEIDASKLASITVRKNKTGTNIDEYGVLKIKDGGYTIEEAENLVKSYLAKSVAAWNPAYLVEEFPKLEKASYKVCGDYVVYAVLAESERNDVFTAVEGLFE